MKSEPRKLIYPFENPSITAGLAAINATAPPFTVEAKHLKAWFKEGVIAHYMLVDDLRELWNREGFGALFDLMYGEAKNYKLIASYRTDMEWSCTEGAEVPSYGVFGINTAEALYIKSCEENPPLACNKDAEEPSLDYIPFTLPSPEPVLPRYEAEKIYSLIHGKTMATSKEPKERYSGKQARVIVDLLSHIGFTEGDFKGPIETFRGKATKIGLGYDLISADKNTLDKWFKSANER